MRHIWGKKVKTTSLKSTPLLVLNVSALLGWRGAQVGSKVVFLTGINVCSFGIMELFPLEHINPLFQKITPESSEKKLSTFKA